VSKIVQFPSVPEFGYTFKSVHRNPGHHSI